MKYVSSLYTSSINWMQKLFCVIGWHDWDERKTERIISHTGNDSYVFRCRCCKYEEEIDVLDFIKGS